MTALDAARYEHIYNRTCGQKRAYHSKAEARIALKHSRATFAGPELTLYRCWIGGGDHWHVGHRPPLERRTAL